VVVSTQSPGASWQSEELAGSYVGRRELLLPMADVQDDVLVKLFSRAAREVGALLDLGSGDGGLSALLLGAGIAREAVLLDGSRPMLDGATERLAAFPGRWQGVIADLGEPGWSGTLPHPSYGAIVSGYAIHHLPPERKRGLYAEIMELLEPGAMFVNVDFVAIQGPLEGLFDEHWNANVAAQRHAHAEPGAGEDLEDDDDRPDPLPDQLEWLREAGFEQVEVHFKWAEAAIFGGVRPGT
jgi:tRNA (cmo5U34)-methyltransferase